MPSRAVGWKATISIHVVGGFVNIWIAKHHDDPFGFGINQLAFGFQNRHQCSFTTYQRTCDIEPPILTGN